MPDAENLEQLESGRGMAPHFNPVEFHDPTSEWPMMIYVMPNGDVIAKRELNPEGNKFGSPHLARRSEMVLRILPQREPGNSDGGAPFSVEVLKMRTSPETLFRSATQAYIDDGRSEGA